MFYEWNVVEGWLLFIFLVFMEEEIVVVEVWVVEGGLFFLIVDYMLFFGLVFLFVNRFGVEMINGFVFEWNDEEIGILVNGFIVFY